MNRGPYRAPRASPWFGLTRTALLSCSSKEARRLITSFADPGMLGSLLDRIERALGRPSRRRPAATEVLTDKELVVLRLLATKLSQPEIAQEFYVSVNTVRTHTQGIYRKLGVASRQEAIAAAREHGLLART